MATISVDTNLSAVGYVLSETLTIIAGAVLTHDTTEAINSGQIECITNGKLRSVNASTTTPIVLTTQLITHDYRFEQNGIWEGRGAFISLGAATGAANETFSLASAPLDIIPYPTGAQVETAAGSGIYIPLKTIPTAGKTVNLPTTEFCGIADSGEVIFWNASTRVLSSGNGTNGMLFPAGANVRIPNIYVHCATQDATPANRCQIDLNPTGTLDMECVGFSDNIYFSASTIKRARLVNCGFCGQFVISNSNAEVIVDHVSVSPDTRQTTVAQLAQISNINGNVQINKYRTYCAGLVTASAQNTLSNLFQITQLDEPSLGKRNGRDNATDESAVLQSLADGLVINGMGAMGGRLELTNISNLTINDLRHADSVGTAQLTADASDAIVCTNVSGLIINGLGNAGIAACRSSILNADAQSRDIQVYGMDYDGAGNTGGILTGSSTGVQFINGVVRNIRTGLTGIDSPVNFLSNETVVKNLRASVSGGSQLLNDGTQNGTYDLLPGSASDLRTTLSGASGYAYANMINVGLTPTTGAVVCGPFSPNDNLTVGGAAYLNQVGGVALPNSADTLEVESLFAPKAITSYQNTSPVWTYVDGSGTITNSTTPPAGVTAEFRVRNPGGSYGAYQALTGPNLNAALAALSGYDSDVGHYIQQKFTTTTADALRVLSKIYMATNIDNTYIAPDASLTLLGPELSDVVTMYLDSDDSSLAVFTGPGAHDISGAAAIAGELVYFTRRNASSVVIMSTQVAPVAIKLGDNGNIDLFSGAEVQLASNSDVAIIRERTDRLPDDPAAVGDAMTLTSGERDAVAAALLNLSDGIETGFTPKEVLRIMAAVLAGKVSGGPYSPVFRNLGDTADRVTAVADKDGNRTSVVLTP